MIFTDQKRRKKIQKIVIKGCKIAIPVLVCVLFFAVFVSQMIHHYFVQATAEGMVKVSDGTALNVRTGPGTNYKILTSSDGKNVVLKNGVDVTVVAKNGDWYRIKFERDGAEWKGYVSGKYVTVLSGAVFTKVPATMILNQTVKEKAGNTSETKKCGLVEMQLVKDQKISILSETSVMDQKWYYISFVYNQKTYKGYVPAVAVKVDSTKQIPGIIKSKKEVQLTQYAGGKTPVYIEGNVVKIANNEQVYIVGEKTKNGVKYHKIKYVKGKNSATGYVDSAVVRFQIVKTENAPVAIVAPEVKPTIKPTPKPTKKPEQTKPDTAGVVEKTSFEKQMEKEGFPADYIKALEDIHKEYPKWSFKAYKSGLDWNEAVKRECKIGLNLLSVNKASAWKSTEPGAYNYKTDTYIPYDGSTWVTASKMAVEYYMDPRNFLDERGIFQFESLEYQKSQTQSGVENILYNTPMYDATIPYKNDEGKTEDIKYSKAFMNAAIESKVSPYHLASRVKQEVVTGPNSMSSSVSGTVSGYSGIYNYYNIGANNSTVKGGAVANGLNWAKKKGDYERPWNTRYKSIMGGAEYIGSKYINVGQNTLYLQKFNITPVSRYDHQYMANIEAPNSESSKTVAAYGDTKDKMSIVFVIPIYENMPKESCDIPSGGGNPNNYLKSLSVSGYAFSSKFSLGDDGSKTYTTTVGSDVSSVKISASAISSLAKVSGTGTKSLKTGSNVFNVKVTSQSGSTRTYKIIVTKKTATTTAKTPKKTPNIVSKNNVTKKEENSDTEVHSDGQTEDLESE